VHESPASVLVARLCMVIDLDLDLVSAPVAPAGPAAPAATPQLPLQGRDAGGPTKGYSLAGKTAARFYLDCIDKGGILPTLDGKYILRMFKAMSSEAERGVLYATPREEGAAHSIINVQGAGELRSRELLDRESCARARPCLWPRPLSPGCQGAEGCLSCSVRSRGDGVCRVEVLCCPLYATPPLLWSDDGRGWLVGWLVEVQSFSTPHQSAWVRA
jgi:hypothetical protein